MITEYFTHEQDPLVSIVRIVIEEQDSRTTIDQALKKYARQAHVKGFRPGHAPMQLIKKMYGKYIIEEEINKLVSQAITKFVENQQWEIIGYPLFAQEYKEKSTFKSNKDYEFWFKVGRVNISEIDFTQLPNKQYQILHSEKDIDNLLHAMYETHKQKTLVETIAHGDLVAGYLSPIDETEKAKFEAYLAEVQLTYKDTDKIKENTQELFVVIPTERLAAEMLPLFKGQNTHSTIYFDIQQLLNTTDHLKYLLGFTKEQIQTLQGQYQLKVTEISRMEMPEKTPELFQQIVERNQIKTEAPVETEEALKELAAKRLIESNQQKTLRFLKHQIKEYLINHTDVQFSQDFLIDYLLANTQQPNTQDRAAIAQEVQSKIKQYKWSFISSYLTKVLDIPEITREEFLNALYANLFSMYSQMFGAYYSVETLHNIVNKHVIDIIQNPQKNHLYSMMKEEAIREATEDKLLAYLVEHKITLETVPITWEEYNAIVKSTLPEKAVQLDTDDEIVAEEVKTHK